MSKAELEGSSAPPEVDEGPADEGGKRLTRGKFIAGAGAAGAGLAFGAMPAMAKGWSPESRNKALQNGLAPGMYGGPTGFKGAERYQYPVNSEEGRAIAALRR